jgi:hypothetical protein
MPLIATPLAASSDSDGITFAIATSAIKRVWVANGHPDRKPCTVEFTDGTRLKIEESATEFMARVNAEIRACGGSAPASGYGIELQGVLKPM